VIAAELTEIDVNEIDRMMTATNAAEENGAARSC